MDLVKTSKFLSLVLRHQPDKIGLKLDEQGWADVSELIRLSNQNGNQLDLDLLQKIVADNDKKRFAFSPDGLRIRASQGHSVDIDLALAPIEPPAVLYHGTALRFLPSIRQTGLNPGSRQHVHLSLDKQTATKVGQRHGSPVILTIQSKKMFDKGHKFFKSENNVWLTDSVPVEYIEFR